MHSLIKIKETFLSLSKQGKQESNPHGRFWRPLNYPCSIPLYVIIKLEPNIKLEFISSVYEADVLTFVLIGQYLFS